VGIVLSSGIYENAMNNRVYDGNNLAKYPRGLKRKIFFHRNAKALPD
jgi:hypothetical protein